MMTNQIISHFVNAIGTFINIIGINLQNKRKILLSFIAGNTFVAVSLGLLGAKIGMVVQFVFVVETIINYFFEMKHDKYPFWLIIIYIIVPSIILVFNYNSILDLLPIIASILFALALVVKPQKVRLFNLFSVIMWIPYNFYYQQYIGSLSCIIFTIINILTIIRKDILSKKKEIK